MLWTKKPKALKIITARIGFISKQYLILKCLRDVRYTSFIVFVIDISDGCRQEEASI